MSVSSLFIKNGRVREAESKLLCFRRESLGFASRCSEVQIRLNFPVFLRDETERLPAGRQVSEDI